MVGSDYAHFAKPVSRNEETLRLLFSVDVNLREQVEFVCPGSFNDPFRLYHVRIALFSGLVTSAAICIHWNVFFLTVGSLREACSPTLGAELQEKVRSWRRNRSHE